MPLTKRIIPCLDVKNGRVVKGTKFVQIKDAGDPVSLAGEYSDQGADELVFLDITASDERRKTIRELVRGVASVIDIPFTVGGGVTTMADARHILLSGADKVGINTGAVNDPTVITDMMDLFGRQCVVVAIDAKRNYDVPESSDGSLQGDVVLFDDDHSGVSGGKFWFEVHTFGGKKSTGIDAVLWAKEAQRRGAGEILLTSIDCDGTKNGYDIALTKGVVDALSIPVVASGGCGHPSDMARVFEATDVDAALAASIFHYHQHGVKGVKEMLQNMGISVRL